MNGLLRHDERAGWVHHYFRIAAVLFAVAAVVHLYQLLSGPGDRLFHAAFVGIDVVVAGLLLLLPGWLPHLFLLLAIEQVLHHGWQFAEAWKAGTFDVVSAAIIVFMPVTAVLLYIHRHRRLSGEAGKS